MSANMPLTHSASTFFDVLTKEDGDINSLKQKLADMHATEDNTDGVEAQDDLSMEDFTPEVILQELLGDLFIHPSRLLEVGKFGEGAFASVHKCNLKPASGEGLKVQVAVKRLKPETLKSSEDLKEFLCEANLLRKLRHPNVVGIIGVGARDLTSLENMRASMFIVMEAMCGDDLKMMVIKQMTQSRATYTPNEALLWSTQIAASLAYLHSVCKPMIIHRDIKLENIMTSGGLMDSSVAKLADFGLHKRARYSKTRGVLVSGGPSLHEANQVLQQLTASGRGFAFDKSAHDKSYYGGKHHVGNLAEPIQPIPGSGLADPDRVILAEEDGVHSLLALAEMQTNSLKGEQDKSASQAGSAKRGGSEAQSALQELGHVPSVAHVTASADPQQSTFYSSNDALPKNSKMGQNLMMMGRGSHDNRGSLDNRASSEFRGSLDTSGHGASLGSLLVAPGQASNVQSLKMMLAMQSAGNGAQSSNLGSYIELEKIGKQGSVHNTSARGSLHNSGRGSVDSVNEDPSGNGDDRSVHRKMFALMALDKCTVSNESTETCSTAPVQFPMKYQAPVGGGMGARKKSLRNVNEQEGSMHPIPEDRHSFELPANEPKEEKLMPASPKHPQQLKNTKALQADDRHKSTLQKQKSMLMDKAQQETAMFADATRQVGSLMYMAPELLNGHEYNEKVDVFSFAIVMFELFMGKLLAMRSEFMMGGVACVEEYTNRRAKGERERIPSKWPSELRNLIEECWDQDPAKRPSFVEVKKRLQEMKQKGTLNEMTPGGAAGVSQPGCGCTVM